MKRLALLLVCGVAFGVPAAAAASEGTVKGTVTPLKWAQETEVCVSEAGPSETCTSPAADGTYSLEDVPFFGAKVEFVPSVRSQLLREYYDEKVNLSQATVIVLTPAKPVIEHVDGHLREGGEIAGSVAAVDGGEPLREVEVCAMPTGQPSLRRCGETDTAGGYEIFGLASDTYTVSFWGSGASAEYEHAQQQAVIVNAGATTSSVDAALAKGGRIDGRLTAAAGAEPLPDISICLFSPAGARPLRCGYSDEAGDYSFVGLPGGEYQVGFSLEPSETGSEGGGEPDGYESQYYDGVSTRDLARTISLPPSTAVAEVDAALLVPPASEPLAAAPLVTAPIVPAAPPVLEPTPQKKTFSCRKGYKKKVRGRVRCSGVAKKPKKASKHGKAKPKKGGKK
jgi:hypothetical protein